MDVEGDNVDALIPWDVAEKFGVRLEVPKGLESSWGEVIISHLHTKSALLKKSHAVQIYYCFCLYFHFAPLLCLDFHFAPLLSLDFSLRPTSQFGFFTSPHFSVWIFTSPHFSVWIFHFAPLLCLDFSLRPTSLFGFSLGQPKSK